MSPEWISGRKGQTVGTHGRTMAQMDHLVALTPMVITTKAFTKLVPTAALVLAKKEAGAQHPALGQTMQMALLQQIHLPMETVNMSFITTLTPELRRRTRAGARHTARDTLGLAADGLRPSKGSWHSPPLLENHIQHFLVALA